MGKKTIITGVIGVDCHVVGLRLLEHALREAGFEVVSLGAQVTQEEFITAAIQNDAGAILVSSIYGLGEIDCKGFGRKCEEAGLGNVVRYVGGNLVCAAERRESQWEDVERSFKEMGFRRIYPPEANLETMLSDLKSDLGIEGGRTK